MLDIKALCPNCDKIINVKKKGRVVSATYTKDIEKISIDIDSGDIENLTRQVWKAVKRPFLEEIAVERSPSGKGFHIRGYNCTFFDDIVVRSALGDDPVRLRYSIKRSAIGGKEDIVFDCKSYEDGIKYSRDITEKFPLEKMKKMNFDEVKKLAKKLEDEIETEETWVTGIRFNGLDLKERLEEVCERISDGDDSFGYNIYENKQPESDFVLYLYSPTKDEAQKKGSWFVGNPDKGNLGRVFNSETPGPVTEGDLDKIVKFDGNYYWTNKKKGK